MKPLEEMLSDPEAVANVNFWLRELHAAAALAGMLASPDFQDPKEELARAAYALADAMLAEREKK
jgi:hypothetical protein